MWFADIIIAFILAVAVILAIRYWSFFKKTELSFLFLLSTFFLKVGFGIAYTYIQLHYYKHPLGGDSMIFFNDAKIIYNSYFTFKKDFFKMLFSHQDQSVYFVDKYYQYMSYWNEGMQTSFYNDNRLFVKLNTILMFLSHGNIYLHMIIINFASLIGLVALFNGLKLWLNSLPFRMIAVFFFPTVLLWCSAIHKETFVLFFIGLSLNTYYNYTKENKFWRLLVLGLVLFLSIWIKPYISCFIVAYIVMLLVLQQRPITMRYFTIVYTLILFCGAYFFSQKLDYSYNPWRPLLKKQIEFGFAAEGGFFMFNQHKVVRLNIEDSTVLLKGTKDSLLIPKGIRYEYWNIANLDKRLLNTSSQAVETFAVLHKMPKAGSAFQYHLKIESFYEYCRSILLAEFAVLFKPLFFDAHSLMAYFSSIENLFLLLLVLLSVFFLVRKGFKHDSSVYLLLLFITVIFFILGFTVNISGALSRYRAPVMPLFLAVCFSLFPFADHPGKR